MGWIQISKPNWKTQQLAQTTRGEARFHSWSSKSRHRGLNFPGQINFSPMTRRLTPWQQKSSLPEKSSTGMGGQKTRRRWWFVLPELLAVNGSPTKPSPYAQKQSRGRKRKEELTSRLTTTSLLFIGGGRTARRKQFQSPE